MYKNLYFVALVYEAKCKLKLKMNRVGLLTHCLCVGYYLVYRRPGVVGLKAVALNSVQFSYKKRFGELNCKDQNAT